MPISQSVNCRRIGTIIWSVDRWCISAISIINSRHSGAISLLMVCSSTVPASGSGSQAYWCGVLSTGHNSTGILVRSLSIQVAVQCQQRVGSVGRLVRSLVIGWVYRHISYNSYRVCSCCKYWQFFLFVGCLRNYTILTASPLYYFLCLSFTVPFMRTSCLNHIGSHLCSHLGNCGSLKILLHARSSGAC